MPAPVGNKNGSKWTPEQDAFLRLHVEQNQSSYATIAARLNEHFSTTYSRNAAIGRAGRMGLINPFRVKPCKVKAERVKSKPRPRIISSNGNSNSMRMFMSVENVAQVKLRCVEIVPRNLSLVDLEPNDCRYPYGENVITFCGHQKAEGSSYCVPHHALCHTYYNKEKIGVERPDITALNRKNNLSVSATLARFDVAAET